MYARMCARVCTLVHVTPLSRLLLHCTQSTESQKPRLLPPPIPTLCSRDTGDTLDPLNVAISREWNSCETSPLERSPNLHVIVLIEGYQDTSRGYLRYSRNPSCRGES